jgi:hypothetical protein
MDARTASFDAHDSVVMGKGYDTITDGRTVFVPFTADD